MAQIEIKNLIFKYPEMDNAALKDINLEVEQGEFVVLCGPSGSGKTTLARLLKQSIAPYGEREGQIFFEGCTVQQLDLKTETAGIGYVFQHPKHQIVANTIGHELAFGLENLGVEPEEMALRVAETADYFGFTKRMEEKVDCLSGGQQQLLNIASVMTMQPKVIILDEPTAQLDPVAAENLLMTVGKINRDFGITIIMIEHQLKEIMYMAHKLVVMDKGRIISQGEPQIVLANIKNHDCFKAMPERVRLYARLEQDGKDYPLTVGQARTWIKNRIAGDEAFLDKLKHEDNTIKNVVGKSQNAIEIRNVWFRYERNSEDVLNGVDLDINKGVITGIAGGNGSGKSTLMKLICGLCKPYRGKIKAEGRVSMLVQDVQCIFSKETVLEELSIITSDSSKLERVISDMNLEALTEQHPYDLSGGEQQRLGIAKLLLVDGDILIFDEPTKGMDEIYKAKFGTLLSDLSAKGKTIIIVSHDLEFMSAYTHRCAFLFDGRIVSYKDTRDFFKGNRYYTTELEKLCQNY